MRPTTHNSYYIKNELMYYWRCTRQCLCADEVNYGRFIADVIVVTKPGYILEIEVKTAKSDLCTAELSKHKHTEWKEWYPHCFSFAVPTNLIEDAKKIIEKLNPKYGLIEITNDIWNPITIRKSPQRLHDNDKYAAKWHQRIVWRLGTALIYTRKRLYNEGESLEEYNI